MRLYFLIWLWRRLLNFNLFFFLILILIPETLRKCPPNSILTRECTKDYLIEETGQMIKSGIKIIIPISSIHNDAKYFKNPHQFMPERFHEFHENTKYFTPHAYMPFGDTNAPRQCPGRHLGQLIVKSAVVSILSSYTLEFDVAQSSPHNIKMDKCAADEMLTKVLIKPRTEINNN